MGEPPKFEIRYDPRKLFIGNLIPGFATTQVEVELSKLGVVARHVKSSDRTPGKLGSCHVEFHTHAQAARARGSLYQRRFNHPLAAYGQTLTAHRGPRLFTDYQIMVEFFRL